MSSSEAAARIIDLYQRQALDWIEKRAQSGLFERAWLDRFRALLPANIGSLLGRNGFRVVSHVADDRDCGGHTIWLAQRIDTLGSVERSWR